MKKRYGYAGLKSYNQAARVYLDWLLGYCRQKWRLHDC